MQVPRRRLHELSDCAGLLAGDEMVGVEPTLGGAGQLDNRVRDMVDGDDVDRCRAGRGEHPHLLVRERAHRHIEDVERGSPATGGLADDDAWSQDRDRRQQRCVRAHELFGFILGALIAVAEPLRDVEVVLAELSVDHDDESRRKRTLARVDREHHGLRSPRTSGGRSGCVASPKTGAVEVDRNLAASRSQRNP